MAPAPFTAYSSGPGYVVTAAELPPIPANAQTPADRSAGLRRELTHAVAD
jgi:hypothetical protein